MQTQLTPTTSQERMELLDILRGLAIFGVLLVNFYSYAWPREHAWVIAQHPEPLVDVLAHGFVYFFAKGKFVTLLSILFGIGLAIQYDRCLARGRSFFGFGLARLAVLFPIGLAHGFLIWWGDILAIYAIVGFMLLFFLFMKPVNLLRMAFFFTVFYMSFTIWTMIPSLSPADPSAIAETQTRFQERQAIYVGLAEESTEILLHGSYKEVVVLTARHLGTLYQGLPFWIWTTLASFLLGAWSWRSGWLRDIVGRRSALKKILMAGLIIGIPCNLVQAMVSVSSTRNGWSGLTSFLGQTIGQYAFAAVFLAFFALNSPKKWSGLAYVGRMALSNYLSQSLVFTFIFYGHGLGFMGQVGPALGLLLCVVFFGLQMWLSRHWLSRFNTGPFEWLWRRLAYGLFGIFKRSEPE